MRCGPGPTASPAPPDSAGKSSGNESVTSAKWGVTASVTTMTFTTNTYQTSTVTNNGTVALVAESYSVTVSNPTSGSPTFKVFQCAVGMVGEQVLRRRRHPGRRHPGQELDHHHHQHDGDGRRRPLYLQVEPTGVTASTVVTISTKIAAPSQLRAAVKTNQ